ncbi:MAG: helix-turn-helix domain-containing protein, partial [Bacilli bacterium]|nr:helix-turn-helix domain-containing protein [Bacilli bacterium]
MNQELIGKAIKEIRKKENLSQQKFAEKYGVTYQAVSKWENGKNIPDISTLKEICNDYNLDLNDFLDAKIKNKRKINKYAI